MTTHELLDHCRGCVRLELAPGAVLLGEGERTGRLFVLAEGCLEVFRGDVRDRPGRRAGRGVR